MLHGLAQRFPRPLGLSHLVHRYAKFMNLGIKALPESVSYILL